MKGAIGDEVKRTQSSSVAAPAGDKFGVLRQPSVVGSASALIGLVVGVVLGRTSAVTTADETLHLNAASRKAEAHSTFKADETEEAPPASPEFRRGLGLRPPSKDEGKGFDAAEVNRRPVVRLAGRQATLHFEIEAEPGDYVFTAVIHLEGAGKATLHPLLDGHALADANLVTGWGMYSSPIPRDELSGTSHELTLGVDAAAAASVVSLDSVAVVPIGSAVALAMGEGSTGSLIEGFSKPGKGSTWSEGTRSRLGVVLSPTAAPDYRLTVLGSAAPGTVPQRVSAKVNGTDVGATEVALTKGESSWVVPAKALHPGLNLVELGYSKTSRPSEVDPQSKDSREIAVRFSRLSLEPSQ